MVQKPVGLHQVIAVIADAKKRSSEGLEKAKSAFQKASLLQGISRTYQPKSDEDEERLPSESNKVQIKASEIIGLVQQLLIQLYDEQLTLDTGNCKAKADIAIDGKVLLPQVPVAYLLFLEKQMGELEVFVKRIPILDLGEDWHYDESQAVYATRAAETTRGKKTPKVLMKAAPTQYHPAQVEVLYEDNVVGFWKTVKYSGALPQHKVNEILFRIEQLSRAVKLAREEANRLQLPIEYSGEVLLSYVFGEE